MKSYSTKGKSVEVITFELDGVELKAYKPKKSLLMEIAEMVGLGDGLEGASQEAQMKAGVSIAQTCINLIPKVFDPESREHLEGRVYDPADPFDIMPSEEGAEEVCLFNILGDLMDTLAGKDEASKPTSGSRNRSTRPVKASTVTARSRAAASTTGRSRTKG